MWPTQTIRWWQSPPAKRSRQSRLNGGRGEMIGGEARRQILVRGGSSWGLFDTVATIVPDGPVSSQRSGGTIPAVWGCSLR